MKIYFIIVTLLQFTLFMDVSAQIKGNGIGRLELGKPISAYQGAVKFNEYSQEKLFYASPKVNFYNIPLSNIKDSGTTVRYAFAYVDSKGTIKRIILIIDDSTDTLIDTLKERIGNEYTTGQTSIGRMYGYAAYSWVTAGDDYILMIKDVASDKNLNFPVTKLEFTKRSDLADLIEISFRVKTLNDH